MRFRLISLVVITALAVFAAPALANGSITAPSSKKAKKACALKKKAKCRKANLAKRKIGKVNLAGADLRNANLSGATLTGTILKGADLRGADLTGTRFVKADLGGVDLRGARLRDTSFKSVNFAAFAGSTRVARASAFAGLKCLNAIDPEATIGKFILYASCPGADFSGTTISGVFYQDSDLTGVNFGSAAISDTTFGDHTLLNHASLRRAKMSSVAFTSVEAESADFGGVTCVDCRTTNSDFKGSNFLGMTPTAWVRNQLLGDINTLGARGLDGTTSFSFANADVTASSVTEAGYWGGTAQCGSACSSTNVPIGSSLSFDVGTAAGPGLLTATGGLACSAAGAKPSCSGTVTGAVTITFTRVFTVTVHVDQIMGMGPLGEVTISTVSGGVATVVKRCTTATACDVTVVSGSVVRISGSDSAYTVMAQCPGSTEWTPGSSILSPPSVLTCPDYTASADVTATFEAS